MGFLRSLLTMPLDLLLRQALPNPQQAAVLAEIAHAGLGRALAAQRLVEGLAGAALAAAILVAAVRAPEALAGPTAALLVQEAPVLAAAAKAPEAPLGPIAPHLEPVALVDRHLLWVVRVQASAGTQRPSKRLRFAMLLKP